MNDFKMVSLNDLMLKDDEEFVKNLYLTLLNRHADTSGMNHYLHMLRTGTHKSSIVKDILRSQECISNKIYIKKLNMFIFFTFLAKLPILKAVFPKIYKVSKMELIHIRLDAIQKKLLCNSEELQRLSLSITNLHQDNRCLVKKDQNENYLNFTKKSNDDNMSPIESIIREIV